jgi:hypothetical protein
MTTHHRSLRFVSLAGLSANAGAKVERGARAGAGSGLVVEYRGQLDTQRPGAGCVMRSPPQALRRALVPPVTRLLPGPSGAHTPEAGSYGNRT